MPIIYVNQAGTDLQRGDALLAAYATAKGMSPASNNRILIRLGVGFYHLRSVLTMDTSYIDMSSVSATVYRLRTPGLTSGPVVKVACNDFQWGYIEFKQFGLADDGNLGDTGSTQLTLGGFTDSAADHTVVIAAGLTLVPTVVGCKFRHKHPGRVFTSGNADGTSGTTYAYTLACLSDMGGTWTNCEFDDWSLRPWLNIKIGGSYVDCKFGRWGPGGDAAGSDVTGIFTHCHSHDFGFGSCSGFGSPFSGTITSSIVGRRSIGIGYPMRGKLDKCVIENGSVSGGAEHDAAVPCTVTGTILDTTIFSAADGGDADAMTSLGGLANGVGAGATMTRVTVNGLCLANSNSTFTSCFFDGHDPQYPSLALLASAGVTLTGNQYVARGGGNYDHCVLNAAGSQLTLAINGIANVGLDTDITNTGTLTVTANQTTQQATYGDAQADYRGPRPYLQVT